MHLQDAELCFHPQNHDHHYITLILIITFTQVLTLKFNDSLYEVLGFVPIRKASPHNVTV